MLRCWYAWVFVLPFIITSGSAQDQFVNVYEHAEIVLQCNHKSSAGRHTLIQWRRGSQILAQYKHSGPSIDVSGDWNGRANFTTPFSEGNVRINSINLTDDAVHCCTFTDHLSSTTRNWTISLTVLVKPNQPTISGADAAVKEADPVSVTCTVTRVKPVNLLVISWNVEDNGSITGVTSSTQNADGKTFRVENTARLTADRQQDGKTLTCRLMWNNTADFTTVTKTLNINYAPRSVRLTPSGASRVKQGTSVTMTCQIGEGGAKPLPTLSIFKEGITEPIKSQHNTAEMTHTMSIQSEDNGKVFKCKATGGVISGSVDSQGISYDVLYPASGVTVTGVNGPVVEGTTVTLHCQAVDGNPNTYTYKWTHERNGQRSGLPESSSTLTLSNIQYMAAGQYKCQATNEYGPAEGFRDVIVHYSPKEDPNKTPIFKVAAKTGDTKNLTMHVIALPVNVEFSWFHLEKKVDPDRVIKNGLSSTLMLANISEVDFGNYTCIANNTINQAGEFVFHVLGRQAPLAPEDINIVRRTAVSLMVKWKRSFDGGFKQHFKVKYKKMGSSEVKETDKIEDPFPGSKYAQTKVTPLDPGTEYDLYVVAFSDFNGGSETPSGQVTVQTPARPQFNLDKFMVKRKGSEATLTWVRPTGQYTHYVIEWCEKPGKTNCKTENQGNETESTTVSSLRDGQEYSFVLKVYDGDDLVVQSQEFRSLGGGVDMLGVAIGVPVVLIAIITAVLVTIMVRRHKSTARDKTDTEMNGSSHLMRQRKEYGGADGIDNQALQTSSPDLLGSTYEQIGQVNQKNGDKKPPKPTKPKPTLAPKPSESCTYAEVKKPKKASKPEGTPQGPVYAQVDKKNKTKAAQDPGPVYAEVNKKDKKKDTDKDKGKAKTGANDTYAQPDKKKKDKKDKKGKQKKEAFYGNVPGKPGEELYENVNKTGASDEGENPYQNVEESTGRPQNVGVDGTVYAEVEILKKPVPGSSDNQKVHRKEEPVEYAAIDFNKKAPPLQEETAENKANEKAEEKDNLI